MSWRGRRMPESGWPSGYSALIEHFDLAIPAPPRLAMVAERHEPEEATEWQVLPRRRRPDDTLADHLEFALKYEGVNLAVLNELFKAIPEKVLSSWVEESSISRYTRRVWFLYEWLTGRKLDVPDVEGRPAAVDAVDPTQQVALPEGELSRRHRVRNNLPGSPRFCPMVRWTEALREKVREGLEREAREVVGRTHPDVTARAAAFLQLSDSRSSFELEGESPPHDRTRRWGQAIAEAGTTELTVEEFVRL